MRKGYLVIGYKEGKKRVLRECETLEVAEMVSNTSWVKFDKIEIQEIEISSVVCY